MLALSLLLSSCMLVSTTIQTHPIHRSIHSERPAFSIDYGANSFVKDGQPFRYVSGSMHYFRMDESDWLDRLHKARCGGLHAIQTYIEWSSHQPQPDHFRFDGNLNFTKFFRLAQEQDLLVIVGLGPFIASERDNSGLPYWLVSQSPSIGYRTSHGEYLNFVAKWYALLLPMLRPLLYENGGAIIMVQVENEYGSFTACDYGYTSQLRDMIRHHLGHSLQLFSVDGAGQSMLRCGIIDEVYPTVDFGAGADVKQCFETQRLFAPRGPLVNTEYYPGWFDAWGEPHQTVSVEEGAITLDQMLAANASVNIYMYHGGTSFALENGAYESGGKFRAMVTSYDYDAPLGEDGTLRPKYTAFREVISKYFPKPTNCEEVKSTNEEQSNINITLQANMVMDLMQMIARVEAHNSTWPMTFEDLYTAHGFMYYETRVNFRVASPVEIKVTGLYDRGMVFVNNEYRATISRMDNIFNAPLDHVRLGDCIGILVENQGRACCGKSVQQKGITSNVTLGGVPLADWRIYPLGLDLMTMDNTNGRGNVVAVSPSSLASSSLVDRCQCDQRTIDLMPALYQVDFKLDIQQISTNLYLNLNSCGFKGVAMLNDFILGRYWPQMGPQVTLYVPRGVFRSSGQVNRLRLFELERSGLECLEVSLTDVRILNGSTPQHYTTTLNS